jgi:PadR family transcriptional regulator PadR
VSLDEQVLGAYNRNPITISDNDLRGYATFRDFFLGFIRIHILYHAQKEPIYGLDFLQELSRHGYPISPGTLYPIFHKLEKEGYLVAEKRVVAGKVRKYYRATQKGEFALREAVEKARQLWNEIRDLVNHD